MLNILIETVWLMLPAYTPNSFAVVFGGGKPIDLGKRFVDGRRILGDGKTFRGFFFGVFGGVLTGCVQYWIEKVLNFRIYSKFPFLEAAGFFLLFSLGSLTGDVFGSFVKRRMGIERGGKAPILDQIDFLIFAFLFAYFHPIFLELFDIRIVVIAFIITPILHRLTNLIAYLLKLKDVPW